jgi:hypothetical protein
MTTLHRNVRDVVQHLPWMFTFVRQEGGFALALGAARLTGATRIRLGRATRVGGDGALLCQGPWNASLVPWGAVLPAGVTLVHRFISHGYEDPCSWVGPAAPVFEVEDGQFAGGTVGFYLAWLDDVGIQEALAIETLSEDPA